MTTNMHAAETNGGSDANWKDSYKTAQMITLPDVTRICGEQAGQLVQELAQGVGCPEEFILFPLLSCCSALMGHRSEIRVHSAWSEPPVLWFIIGATGCTRKSAALRQVMMPLLDLADEKRREQSLGQLQQHPHDDESGELDLPVVFTCALSKEQLHRSLQQRGGEVLHITEGLEHAHNRLQMHALHRQDLATSQHFLHDLYEAFAGPLGLPPPLDQSASGRGKPVPPLTQAVSYNQCGFASPEYVVNLTVKAPSWLSGRFLVSCPPVAEESGSALFHIPHEEDNSQEDEDGRGPSSTDPPRAKRQKRGKKLVLKDVYRRLAQAHSQKTPRRYLLTKDAVHELQRFQEEEWCTIVNQLGGDDNSGVVGKSLGQIVRLSGALKALTEASQPERDVVIGFSTEQVVGEEGEEVQISGEEVARAVELGKYFLEQKLSMTFMVSTGFFRACSSNSTPRQSQATPSSTPGSGAGDFSFMPPPDTATAPIFGFSRPSPSPTVSTGGGGGGVVSSPSLQSSHLPSPHSVSASLQPPQSAPFPFNMIAGMQSPAAFSMMAAACSRAGGTHPPSLPSISVAPGLPPSSSSSTLSGSASTAQSPSEIDVAQLPATWIPTTPEEEMAEMSQAAEFVQLEPAQFVAIHARRVKRLLECFDDGCGVSATTAAQKSIAPPVRVAGTNNRHPAWASALFFQKVADLGLGVAEQVRHPTNGRVYWRFKRKALADLTEKNIQLLQYLRIDMLRYARLGQPTVHVPGLDLPDSQVGSSVTERASTEDVGSSSGAGALKGNISSNSNGNSGNISGTRIKQESVDLL